MEYDGLEIVGEMQTWLLNVRRTLIGQLMPKIELDYYPVKEIVMGEEAARQLKKWADIPIPERGNYTLYGRCRVDFYVAENDD